MIYIKPGVSVARLKPQMNLALLIAGSIFAEQQMDMWITSGDDGSHSAKSLHWLGCAVDLRTRHLPVTDKTRIVMLLKRALADAYDVVLEPTHIHLEWDPCK